MVCEFGKYIMLVDQLYREDSMDSFAILMMKMGQIVIKLDDRLWKKITKMHYPHYIY